MKHLLKLLLVEIQNRFMCMKKHFFFMKRSFIKLLVMMQRRHKVCCLQRRVVLYVPLTFFLLSLSLLARCSFSGLNLAMREHKT